MSVQSSVERRCWTAIRPGFTMIEVVIVMMIMGILGTIMVPQFRSYTNQREVANARDAFIRTAAQARAAAIQAGDQVEMRITPASDLVVVVVAATNDTVSVLDLGSGDIRANLVGVTDASGSLSADAFRVCYVPRGYARPACGTSQIPATVTFVSRSRTDTARARINIGQAERQ